MAPQPPSADGIVWFFAVLIYVATGIMSFTLTDRLDNSEKAVVVVFWPLVVGYLAVTGLGKPCARLGQEKD